MAVYCLPCFFSRPTMPATQGRGACTVQKPFSSTGPMINPGRLRGGPKTKHTHWIRFGPKTATEKRMQCLNVSLTQHHCYSTAKATDQRERATATNAHRCTTGMDTRKCGTFPTSSILLSLGTLSDCRNAASNHETT